MNDFDSSGRTALHNAIIGRHVKIVELLLESGADTSLLDRSQDAPLHSAVRSGKEALIEVSCSFIFVMLFLRISRGNLDTPHRKITT